MSRLPTLIFAALLSLNLVTATAATTATTQTTRPAAAAFFNNAALSNAKLSPDARALAVRVPGANGRDTLAVIDLETMEAKIVFSPSDADVNRVQWVNSKRLVFDLVDRQSGRNDTWWTGPGMYAVNRDGTGLRQLVERTNGFRYGELTRNTEEMLPYNTYLTGDVGNQDSDYVTVSHPHYIGYSSVDYIDLQRLNTVTGRVRTVERPGNVRSWLVDTQGIARVTSTIDNNVETILYRDTETTAWRKLTDFDAFLGGPGEFNPIYLSPEGKLYVSARKGEDKASVYVVDTKTGQLAGKPIVVSADFDFQGHFVDNGRKTLGMHYLADGPASVWFDPGMKTAQDEVDALLPNTFNRLDVARRDQTPNILVSAVSDIQPTVYLLYNTETKKLNKIGSSRPQIDPLQMASMEMVRYKARDGLEIPAWLTLPSGGKNKNLPLVVLVHGGPFVRGGSLEWNAESQFLASRGYAVLEPEFRGSTGFGKHHFQAGWKQWGLAMQDDIADGTKWAIAQGVADPKRVCIAGGSYGGYAAMMGLIKDPDLYKCGINWVGVADIPLMVNGQWLSKSDLSDEWKHYGVPTLVGDLKEDAAQLIATSPLQQAARLKQPLLMAYGAGDMRVPPLHGTKMRDALAPTNKNVEWILYQEEGHGWALPKNRIDFWTRVETFLDKNIGQH